MIYYIIFIKKGAIITNIAILGFGVVGSGVAEVVTENLETIEKRIKDKLNIKYTNNGGKNVTLVVDGKAIDSNIVPAFDDNAEHDIEVIIG